MSDTYFDWFRTALGRPDPFPDLDDARRAALDEIPASRAAASAPGAAGRGGPLAGGSSIDPPSEYLWDVAVAWAASGSFPAAESWAAGPADLPVGQAELPAEAAVPDYGGEIYRVDDIGSSMYVNEGGAFFDGETGVSVIPGEGVSY